MRLDIIHLEEQLIAESVLSKTAATVAMILAFGVGGDLIHKMLSDRGIDPETAKTLAADPEVQREAERMREQIQPTPEEPEPVNTTVTDEEYIDFISHWEGREREVYNDIRGIPTIGVGFNLQRADAPQLLSAVGADYRAVLGGRLALNDQQIDWLLQHDIDSARGEVIARFPAFDTYPREVKLILVDLMFNLGQGTFNEFQRFGLAIRQLNWLRAADELEDSQYFHQTGRRSRAHVDTLRSL